MDRAVVRALPPGVTVLSVEPHGQSAWFTTQKIDTQDIWGELRSYFMKSASTEDAAAILEGEFAGMSAVAKVSPHFVPKPITRGKLEDAHVPSVFFLMEFKDMDIGLPNPTKLATLVSEVHRKSSSPTGKFGFHMMTYDGVKTQAVEWDGSWTSFFIKLLKHAYEHDVRINGVWKELDVLLQKTIDFLIPRLIGALESEGRSIKPCLIHGNMWEGNIGTDNETSMPLVYDCAAYYGHNEMELAIWCAGRHKLKDPRYLKAYLQNCRPAEPRDEFRDRIRLYTAKTNFMHSACVRRSPSRLEAYEDLKYLIEKYVPEPAPHKPN